MYCYRLYFLHPASGHIIRFAEYEAPGDAAAVALAAEHEGAHPLELWCQHRKVMRFEQVASGAVGLGRRFGANASFPISRRSFSLARMSGGASPLDQVDFIGVFDCPHP